MKGEALLLKSNNDLVPKKSVWYQDHPNTNISMLFGNGSTERNYQQKRNAFSTALQIGVKMHLYRRGTGALLFIEMYVDAV